MTNATSQSVTFTDDEVSELRQLLDVTISDMSPEIADTDNPRYRASLRERRDRLVTIQSKVCGTAE